jgi:hypothetical protein
MFIVRPVPRSLLKIARCKAGMKAAAAKQGLRLWAAKAKVVSSRGPPRFFAGGGEDKTVKHEYEDEEGVAVFENHAKADRGGRARKHHGDARRSFLKSTPASVINATAFGRSLLMLRCAIEGGAK